MPQVFNSETEREKKKGNDIFGPICQDFLPPLPSSISKRTESMAGTVSVVNFFPDPTRAPREESTSRQLPSFCL